MNESRKQFLEWFGEAFESINNSEELHVQAIKMIAWQSWVKSRAVIEIELPRECNPGDCFTDVMIPYEVVEAILDAGIKVKE